jgi:hypothetical protein
MISKNAERCEQLKLHMHAARGHTLVQALFMPSLVQSLAPTHFSAECIS